MYILLIECLLKHSHYGRNIDWAVYYRCYTVVRPTTQTSQIKL